MGLAATICFCELALVSLEPKSFGERLREVRKARRVKQEHLAEAAGVSQSYISQLERGKIIDAGTTVVREIEDALSVYRGYLTEADEVLAARGAAVDRLVARYGRDLRITDEDAGDLRLRWAFLIPSFDPPLEYWLSALAIVRAWRQAGPPAPDHQGDAK